LSQLSQVKLLRLLQGQEYYPLGSDVLKASDARIIVATNHNLHLLLEKGKFRKDLYYRLCSYHVNIPPFRERPEDVPMLLNHFVEEAALSLGKPKPVPSPEVAAYLAKLNFPGNIREFKAVVADAVARHKTGLLSLQHFSGITRQVPVVSDHADDSGVHDDEDLLSAQFGRFPTLLEVEEYMINRAMKLAKGRQSVAASLLGITRQGLHKRIRWNRQ